MKTTVELNAYELKQAALDGTLQALAVSCLSLESQELKESQIRLPQGGQPVPPIISAPPTQTVPPAPPVCTAPIAISTPAVAPPAAYTAPTASAVPSASVPTTAPSYSLPDLAMAGTQLVDAGRRQDVLDLLAAFGCAALTELPKEQYSAYAARLREMGAKI